MPVRNEGAFIARSLGAALSQSYPADRLEILVADGMSDDRTLEIIRSLPDSMRVKVIPNPERVQSAGLNKLIPLTQGAYIIRLDGHTIIAPDYVQQCVQLLQETGADNVGGAMKPVGMTPTGKAIAAAGKSSFGVPSAFHVSDQPQYTDTVYMGAWPRAVFDRVGLFNTQVGVNEDYEFNVRIRSSGGRIYFSPSIQSEYYSRQTFWQLARQYYRYGRSKVKTLRQHPTSLRLRQIIAPLFVVDLAGGFLLSFADQLFFMLWTLSMITYWTLNFIFSLRAASGVAVWRIMIVFFIMHCAWGFGFWRELFKPEPL